MQSLRRPSSSRFAVIAVMVLSWFVITNHCALVRLAALAAEETPCCQRAERTPQKHAPCEEMAQCCKQVKASLAGKYEVKIDGGWFQPRLFAVLDALFAPIEQPARALLFDHGPPPRAVSFAEAVLQRSLLSHAPPFAV